jgi:hypothetical protein
MNTEASNSSETVAVAPLVASTTPVNSPVRLKYGKRTSLKQVVELQRILFDAAHLLMTDMGAETDRERRARIAASIAQVTRSFDTLENRKRILRGRGVPKTVEPSNTPNKGKASMQPYPVPISTRRTGFRDQA